MKEVKSKIINAVECTDEILFMVKSIVEDQKLPMHLRNELLEVFCSKFNFDQTLIQRSLSLSGQMFSMSVGYFPVLNDFFLK